MSFKLVFFYLAALVVAAVCSNDHKDDDDDSNEDFAFQAPPPPGWWVMSLERRILNVERRADECEARLTKTAVVVNRLTGRVAQLEAQKMCPNTTALDQADDEPSSRQAPAVIPMPRSCRDLGDIGHKLTGFYHIKSADGKKIETAYCDFTKGVATKGYETRYGYVDSKSSPVYFYVQKNSRFSNRNVPVPFEMVRLNLGNAMNAREGVFTAPRPGIYSFSFSSIKDDSVNPLTIQLRLNGTSIGVGRGDNAAASFTYSINSILQLKKGDRISLHILEGVLKDDPAHYTHFIGMMLEEDLPLPR